MCKCICNITFSSRWYLCSQKTAHMRPTRLSEVSPTSKRQNNNNNNNLKTKLNTKQQTTNKRTTKRKRSSKFVLDVSKLVYILTSSSLHQSWFCQHTVPSGVFSWRWSRFTTNLAGQFNNCWKMLPPEQVGEGKNKTKTGVGVGGGGGRKAVGRTGRSCMGV